ncbi:MAG: hypothetical protein V7K92_04675 [Nostoc sp.]|uniref:hypothetical protein n=1 Tax=Nostoc sp. TaxID=1180 RepID=UPI002FEF81F5
MHDGYRLLSLSGWELGISLVIGHQVSPSRSLAFAHCWQAAISAWFGVMLSFVNYSHDNSSGQKPWFAWCQSTVNFLPFA